MIASDWLNIEKKRYFSQKPLGQLKPNIFINYCRWFLVVFFFFISNPLLPTVHDIPLDQNRTYTNMCKRFIFINFKLYGPWPKFDFFLVWNRIPRWLTPQDTRHCRKLFLLWNYWTIFLRFFLIWPFQSNNLYCLCWWPTLENLP